MDDLGGFHPTIFGNNPYHHPPLCQSQAEPETTQTPNGCRADQGLRRVPGGFRGSLKDMKPSPVFNMGFHCNRKETVAEISEVIFYWICFMGNVSFAELFICGFTCRILPLMWKFVMWHMTWCNRYVETLHQIEKWQFIKIQESDEQDEKTSLHCRNN